MEIARELGVDGIPSLFLNGKIVQGADKEKVNRPLKK
jgi:protein-disulfide isomerase